MKNYTFASTLLLSTILSFSAQALDADGIKACQAEDEKVVLSSRNYLEIVINSLANATAGRVFLLTEASSNDRETKKRADVYQQALSASKNCAEARSRILRSPLFNVSTAASQREINQYRTFFRKKLTENKAQLKELGLTRASQTLTENEFMIPMSLGLSELRRVFGGKGTSTFDEAVASMHEELNQQMNAVYQQKNVEFDQLAAEFGGSVPENDPRYIEMEARADKQYEEIQARIDQENAKLTAQQIESAIIKIQARDIIFEWKRKLK
jgi:hypothetical protein